MPEGPGKDSLVLLLLLLFGDAHHTDIIRTLVDTRDHTQPLHPKGPKPSLWGPASLRLAQARRVGKKPRGRPSHGCRTDGQPSRDFAGQGPELGRGRMRIPGHVCLDSWGASWDVTWTDLDEFSCYFVMLKVMIASEFPTFKDL